MKLDFVAERRQIDRPAIAPSPAHLYFGEAEVESLVADGDAVLTEEDAELRPSKSPGPRGTVSFAVPSGMPGCRPMFRQL